MEIKELIKLQTIQDFFQINPLKVMNNQTYDLLSLLESCNFEPGTDIIKYGDSGEDGMYIILSGSAEVLDKEEIHLANLGEGSLFGEMALISGKGRNATIRARSNVEAVRISRDIFNSVVSKNPTCYATFMENLYSNLNSVIAERERIKAELSVAKKIQESILERNFEKFSNSTGFEVFASMEAAKEVGGDFYDIFKIDSHRYAFLIADVSGKGVSAALFMVMAKNVIKRLALMGFKPSEILEKANNELCENNEAEMFVTAFLTILDTETKTLIYANAGHNLPLIYKGEKFEWLNTKRAFVLGGMENIRYFDEELKLKSNDELFLYTDGVTEAENKQSELFSGDRLINLFDEKNYQSKRIADVTTDLRKEIKTFANGALQADDITMLLLKIK